MRCSGPSSFHFLPSMIASSAVCATLVWGAGGCSTAPVIVLDGSFDDWEGVKAAVVDPPDFSAAAAGYVDFGSVTVAHDERFVHLLIDLGHEVNPQGLQGTASLLLDSDGDPDTGHVEHGLAGVDVIVDLTPPDPQRPGRPGRGVGLRSTTYQPDPLDESARQLSPYDIGFAFAPTYAASLVEFRLERGVELPHTPVLFAGPRFSGKLVFADVSGSIIDETDGFTCELGSVVKRDPPSQRADPLARSDGELRIMDWNAKRNAVFVEREPAIRTLRAIDPDIVLMQEWMDGVTPEQLCSFFQTELGWENAAAIVGEGTSGGDLHCALVSRYPLRAAEPLKLLTLENQPDRTVRVSGAIAEIGDKRLLVVSVHLKCCGHKGGKEDETRLREVSAINKAIREVTKSEHVDGIVVAGDLNLVGIRRPLDVLAVGADVDGSDLTVASPMQLDGTTNATWSDPAEPFTPGRLDYLLYSDSAFGLIRSLVYDSRDLATRWREFHGITPQDTPTVSDHLPLMVDVKWIHEGS